MIAKQCVAGPIRRVSENFRQDQKGAVAVIFCLALAPLAIMAGAAVDYANLSRSREKLVIGADAAAIAAVVDLQKGGTIEHAQTAARTALQGNMSNLGDYLTINAVTSFVDNRTATTTVKATLKMPNNFGGLFGRPTTEIVQEAVAQGYLDSATYVGAAKSSGTYKGSIYGDPEISYADGKNGFVDCPAPNWYNALSDAGIQINFACKLVGDYNFIRQVTILLGDNVVNYDVYNGPNKDIQFPAHGGWSLGMPATITVDGKEFAPEYPSYPDPAPQLTLVENARGKITVTPNYNTKLDYPALKMYNYQKINVVTPIYKIEISYNYGWYNQQGALSFSADSPGLCGTPGGVWGRSVGGGHVGGSNSGARNQENPFMVLGRESKSPEFFWTPDCPVAVAARNAKLPRLVK